MSPIGKKLFRPQAGKKVFPLVALCLFFGNGCAALTNPVASGIPVRRLPPELLTKPKDPQQPLPLSLLELPHADAYRVAPGDVLGVWVDGVLGDKALPIPLQYPVTTGTAGQRIPGMGAGYPIPVQEDGKISLPLIEPLAVTGLTISEIRQAVRKAYTEEKILAPGKERILLNLLQPRHFQVVVMRQEASGFGVGPQGNQTGLYPSGKRGTGYLVELPAYENDVLHALALTGGLPGLDDYNAIFIFRNTGQGARDPQILLKQMESLPPHRVLSQAADKGLQIIKIPLRTCAGEPIPIRPEDITLRTGDVVYLEARDQEVFFTGGLLPSGEFVLPRDRDLNVVEAIAQARGPLLNGAFGTNNLAGNLIQPGIGQPSPNLVVVLRKIPGRGQVPIRVDLYRAMQDQRENILIQPGDMLILQETPSNALARFATQTLVNFNVGFPIMQNGFFTGAVDFFLPNQLPFRAAFNNFLTRQ